MNKYDTSTVHKSYVIIKKIDKRHFARPARIFLPATKTRLKAARANKHRAHRFEYGRVIDNSCVLYRNGANKNDYFSATTRINQSSINQSLVIAVAGCVAIAVAVAAEAYGCGTSQHHITLHCLLSLVLIDSFIHS